MSPIVSLIIKQLPNLVPVVESLVKRSTAPRPEQDSLLQIELSVDRLAERADRLETQLKRANGAAVLALVLAVIALLAVLLR
ncbi:MAG TPA: hypothetical protein VFS39_00960 [Nitrospira sp.]|nr:hypothetical protein [Nitrospira sp.]